MRLASLLSASLIASVAPLASPLGAQGARVSAAAAGLGPRATPLRQSRLDSARAGPPDTLSLRDASRLDRWLGVGVSDVRWALDGSAVYFRWSAAPAANDDSAADPWFRADRAGRVAEQVPDTATYRIPAARPSWSADGRRAAWAGSGAVYLYDARSTAGAGSVRRVFAGGDAPRNVRFADGDRALDFMQGEDLFRYDVASGELRRLTRRYTRAPDRRTDAAKWLAEQQVELFDTRREGRRLDSLAAARRRTLDPLPAQPIPVEEGVRIDDVQLSPDGRHVTFRWIREDRRRPPTRYMDYVTASGYAEARDARGKAGEPRDEYRLGIVRYDPRADPDSVAVTWAKSAAAGARPVVIHGPYWSLEGDRAAVQVMTQDAKDLWIAALDLTSGTLTTVDHQRDSAWLGGPPPQAQRTQPALLEWLPGGRLAFASERTGWSHLYLAEPGGAVRALTSGAWEVRDARLSRDRSSWLIAASREHPSEDHLYLLPAAGGEMTRLTTKPGRHTGALSPDGRRVADIYSETVQLPDLFLLDATGVAGSRGPTETRVTVSGTDSYWRHRWVRPEMVSFPHADGRPLWGAFFRPERPNAERAAVVHVHGGGYRQFAHRGWSVYGYSSHLGLINYLVGQGYTVLDFDYRGSAGYGRDYRADIYRSMGGKDVEGGVAAVNYLAEKHGVDRARVGVYGVSYGGFFTLMALFRHPGLFAAGIANAAVSDWAHYSDGWTSPILNLPTEDPEAYRASSPIYHAQGLRDPLLIVHGLIDDNVHFQDAARVVQRLIELEKPFEVMYYPTERHVIAGEKSRYDFNRRVVGFFERHLLRRAAGRATSDASKGAPER
ncbi:MAG: prolyl oligopeptidase family serine peptidase [Gemmatimonadaceae bacterium]